MVEFEEEFEEHPGHVEQSNWRGARGAAGAAGMTPRREGLGDSGKNPKTPWPEEAFSTCTSNGPIVSCLRSNNWSGRAEDCGF